MPWLVFAIVIVVTGCREPSQPDAGAKPCAPTPAPVVRVAVGLPAGMGSNARASVSTSPFADTNVIRFDPSGRPIPAIAASWARRDALTYVFTLREGLHAQNGQRLTASRVRHLLIGAVKDEFALHAVWPDVQSIDAPSPTTLVIRLARPNDMLLEALAESELTSDTQSPEWRAGPFRLVSGTPDEMIFEPFAGTWSGPPTVAGMRMTFYPSARAAWAAFMRNDVDMFHDVPPEAEPLLAQSPDVQLFDIGSRFVYTLTFQQRHPVLRDPRVRLAINLSIDREAIVKRLGPFWKVGRGPFSPNYWGAQGVGEAWRYDPVAARALLKEALGGREQPIELECLTTNQYSTYADIAAAIAVQLERVHIRLHIVTLPIQELDRRVMAGNFELTSLPTLTGYGIVGARLFWHGARPVFRTNYTAADTALDALVRATNDDEERAAVREVLDVMHRDPPAAFVVNIPTMRAVRRTWRVPDTDRDIRRTLPYWTFAPDASNAPNPPCEAAR